jgi:hypothetical protein
VVLASSSVVLAASLVVLAASPVALAASLVLLAASVTFASNVVVATGVADVVVVVVMTCPLAYMSGVL